MHYAIVFKPWLNRHRVGWGRKSCWSCARDVQVASGCPQQAVDSKAAAGCRSPGELNGNRQSAADTVCVVLKSPRDRLVSFEIRCFGDVTTVDDPETSAAGKGKHYGIKGRRRAHTTPIRPNPHIITEVASGTAATRPFTSTTPRTKSEPGKL